MSKIADVFGRFEAFSISVLLLTVGYIQQAGANSVETYAAAQIFYSAGSTGLQILQQIFIADTSDLLNRALVSTIPDIPYLINVWIGSPIASAILDNLSWRWGFGVWAIILPVSFLPLALSLWTNQRKAAKRGLLPPSPYAGKSLAYALKDLWYELDFFGLLLLSAAISLILIPLTLVERANGTWGNASMIAMIVVGLVCLIAFPFWERSPRLAPRAFFPAELVRKRTVMAGVGIAFFYFSKKHVCARKAHTLTRTVAFYLSVFPYFYSYLLVVQNKSVTAAGRITQTFTFSATVTSICVSLFMKYTRRYKFIVTAGACLYIVGIAAMIRYRTEGATTRALVACQVAIGVGGGLIHVPAQVGVQASASHSEVGAATAMFLTLLEIGGAVGSSISGAIWSAAVPAKLAEYLPAETQDQAAAIFGNITLASRGFDLGTPTRTAINRAYQETMTRILTVAIVVCIPLIPLSLTMTDYRLDEVGGTPSALHGILTRSNRLTSTSKVWLSGVIRMTLITTNDNHWPVQGIVSFMTRRPRAQALQPVRFLMGHARDLDLYIGWSTGAL